MSIINCGKIPQKTNEKNIKKYKYNKKIFFVKSLTIINIYDKMFIIIIERKRNDPFRGCKTADESFLAFVQ